MSGLREKMSKSGYAQVEADDGIKKIPGGLGTSPNWFHKWTFWWVNPAIEAGYRTTVEDEQLWDLAPEFTLEDSTAKLLAAWDEASAGIPPDSIEHGAAQAAKGEGPPVWEMPFGQALWKVHGPQYKKWLIIKILNDFNQTLPAILLNKILLFLQDPEQSTSDGVYLVLAAFVMMMKKTMAGLDEGILVIISAHPRLY